MKPKQNLILALGIILLAASGNAIWLSEILYRFTWTSMSWLHSPLYSPYLLSAFPVFAFLLPFILSKRVDMGKLMSSIAILYFINLSFYFLGDKLLRMSFSRFGLLMVFFTPNEHLFDAVVIAFLPIILFSLFGLSYTIAVRYFLVNIRPHYLIIFSLIILPVLPLSCFTYMLFPVADTEWFFNAIKAGYPVFWTTILMGLAGSLIEKKTRELTI